MVSCVILDQAPFSVGWDRSAVVGTRTLGLLSLPASWQTQLIDPSISSCCRWGGFQIHTIILRQHHPPLGAPAPRGAFPETGKRVLFKVAHATPTYSGGQSKSPTAKAEFHRVGVMTLSAEWDIPEPTAVQSSPELRIRWQVN